MDVAQDIARGEAAESSIDAFIGKRDRQRQQSQGERAAEDLWRESVRRFHERSEAEMRSRWIDFHQNMHRLHSTLAAEHGEKAEKLLEDEPNEPEKETA